MIQIRSNCFETNSSSSHSLIITKGDAGHYTPKEAYDELYWMNDDGTWSPSSDDMYFGRSPFKVLSSFKDKLCYAYACAPSRKGKMKKSGYNGYWREYYKVTNIVRKFFGDKFVFNGLEPNYRRWNSIGTDDCLLPKWLRDANIYNDQKMLELYKYIDGKLEGVNGALAGQAVWNATQTANINCMQGQIGQLFGLTKLVVPNTSVCPGYSNQPTYLVINR